MTVEFQVVPSNPKSDAEVAEILKGELGFGSFFTDHMISIVWEKETGWQTPEVLPYGPIAMDPANAVLHYGQEIFEGVKAYRHPNGEIAIFRPERNAARFNKSAKRLALPELPEELFIAACEKLTAVDSRWVPEQEGFSLYLRPFMFADEVFLGVRSAHRARFIVIASPSGNYFEGGLKPLKLWLSTSYNRAGVGGTGFAKCGGNYAASLVATDEAFANGCQQVLFTDAGDNDSIDELGGMNLFLVTNDNKLLTPELNGNILAGVTRESIIEIARDFGFTVEERNVTVSEWAAGVKSGYIQEAFACGTAAVIAPIGYLIGPDGFEIALPQPTGDVTVRIREEITGIQFGTRADKRGWLHQVAQ
nr:branched-chain amino acid aminotransferase [Canibacter zhoujuaniae]